MVEGALGTLEEHRSEVNDLNVFPVADGDTGDNMALTLRAVLTELDSLSAQGPVDEIGREEIVDSVARAALLGARGNSGVILSQLIRGAAEELVSRPGEWVDPVLVGAALARAADRAYDSVREPAEGTILTVVREMAHRVASELAHMDEPRIAADGDDAHQDDLIADVLERALDAGQASVRRGPELLPILRDAGVVDAGGFGLTVIFAGVIAVLRGAEPPPLDHHEPARVTGSRPPVTGLDHASETYRYCTNFVVTGTDLEASEHVRALETLGDSVLVVGDRHILKVHVHTDEPSAATGHFDGSGEVSRLDVADMRAQVADRARRLAGPRATTGALAVVAGEGMATLFAGLGATVLDGGATLNPSTHELLAGIHDVPADAVVLLPNSPNVIMAAERAAELSEKEVRVVATRSQQAGLAAAVALAAGQGVAANAAAMEEVLAGLRTGAVTHAARDDGEGRFARGEAVGFVEGALVAWGDPEPTLRSVLERLAVGAELVTVIEGADAPLGRDVVAGFAFDGAELEVERGGQPSYWWLISAE